ncbi:unnamed protein product [Aureobasidium mustum]|uniref:Uncharacterized protein n=1 Tax=Aureobasidium mustum TaxID=2773714 RepID=A0A9N8PCF6_9PEZI|nr:unnamed protein product [Aureobasidium mustum]
MTKTGLLQAGAWNYLREEITVALECQRSVRLNIHLDIRSAVSGSDSMHANIMTYILARVINLCFGQDESGQTLAFDEDSWAKLDAELMFWIAAAQYFLTSKTLLSLQNPNTQVDQKDVERLCGIAYTNENKAARVNAFGPMAFYSSYVQYNEKLSQNSYEIAAKILDGQFIES